MMYKHDSWLSEELGRVAAPEELWDRIQYPQVARSRGLGRRLIWALAASVPVVIAVWCFQPQRAIPLPARQTMATPWDQQTTCLLCHT